MASDSTKMLLRHVVERHLSDKHPEKRPFVKVIRELENTENNIQQTVQEETEEEIPDPDGNHWKCNICEFKCAYKAEMASHAVTCHDEKCQYKCTVCPFKTSGKIIFEQHINSKHACDPNIDYILVYQRIKGVNRRITEHVEQNCQDEPFDTTPLWRRDMPRVRHIRGILLEEEDEIPSTDMCTNPKISPGKRKGDVLQEVPIKTARIKALKYFDENKQSKEKTRKSVSCEKLSKKTEHQVDENQSTTETMSKLVSSTNKSIKDLSKSNTIELNDINDSDVGRFGPYGKPDNNMYVCTLCNQFKTKYKHDMKDHLYRELKYARWHCKSCGYLSVNRNALSQHIAKHHNYEHPNFEPLSPDNAIEDWVTTLLKKQTEIIKSLSQQINTVQKNKTISANTFAASPGAIKPISAKTIQTHKKTVNLASTITTLQSDIFRDSNKNIDIDEDDSRDNEDLVIDIKEDEAFVNKNNENISENNELSDKNEQEKPIVCKHCQMKFNNWRGFKLHVQLTHLKRLGFLCPYCDRSTNSETCMRQHIRTKHPGSAEKIVQNPSAGGPELTNDFWAKEYGLICPSKSKKHKRKLSLEDGNKNNNDNSHVDVQEKCNICGFNAKTSTSLKSHMKLHIPKNNIRCSYCTFSCALKAEMLEHWEINHSMMPFKIQDALLADYSNEIGKVSSPKKQKINAYADDIEEEPVENRQSVMLFSCFYCNVRRESAQSMKQHWNLVHKESRNTDVTSIKQPFKYRKIYLPIVKPAKEDCIKKGTESFRDLAKQSDNLPRNNVPGTSISQQLGWICQWCQEFCETDIDTRTHQNMFHSHLPLNFKRQGEKEEEQSKSMPIQISVHNANKHLTLEKKIRIVPNFDSVVENLINQGTRDDLKDVKIKGDVSQNSALSMSIPKSRAVAKKSTIKSITCVKTIPRIFKSVARKSTNPLPRYLPGVKSERDVKTESKPFSYYRMSNTPVDLAKLNTHMVVGGHSMKLNCATLAKLININPKIVLENTKPRL